MRKTVAAAMLVAVTLLGAPVWAPSASAASTVVGKITGISGPTLPATLTVQSGTDAYAVNVTAATSLIRKFNAPSSLEEFGVGDRVQVEGEVTGMVIDATKIKNLSIQRKGAAQWGKVLSIDKDAKTFRFDSHRRGVDNLTVTTSDSTKYFLAGRGASFSDLKVGMIVKVVGLWRRSQDTLEAERILMKPTVLQGVLKTIDCESDPQILTVQTNSGKKQTTWTVKVKDTTVIRDRSFDQIACGDLKTGRAVHIQGVRIGEKLLVANVIVAKSIEKSRKAWGSNTIVSIDTDARTFVMKLNNKKLRTVHVVPESILVNHLGSVISFGNLEVGHKVKVLGTLSGTDITANLVIDRSL